MQWSISLKQNFLMTFSGPQDEDQTNTPSPPTSRASWEQFLGDSTIWLPRNMFYRKVHKSKVTVRVDSESLDQFLEAHGHQGQTGSRSWGTAPSGSPGSCFTKKFINKKVLLGLKVTAQISFWRPTDIRDKLGADHGGQHNLAPQEDMLYLCYT